MLFSVILVRPIYPRNIGMVARAMCNFGLEKLVVIAPQCELDIYARQGAAQGQQPLRDCTVYQSWDEYTENEPDSIRIGFSRRESKRRTIHSVKDTMQWPAIADGRPVSLMFGAEDDGLTRDDLTYAHRICALDIPGPLKSLNLSHAVILVLSQLPRELPAATVEQDIVFPDDALKLWLESLEIDLSHPNWNAFIAMRQLIMKAAPTEQELILLNRLIQQTARKLREADEESPRNE